jgi:hypothetical protein
MNDSICKKKTTNKMCCSGHSITLWSDYTWSEGDISSREGKRHRELPVAVFEISLSLQEIQKNVDTIEQYLA